MNCIERSIEDLASMFGRLKCLLHRVLSFDADHDWHDHDGSTAKRICSRCKKVEWLFSLPFASTTQPSLQWKDMTPGREFLRRRL